MRDEKPEMIDKVDFNININLHPTDRYTLGFSYKKRK